jgi:hypothetical protein
MTCIEDGKHLRMSVFEGPTLRHLTVRVSSTSHYSADPRPPTPRSHRSSARLSTSTCRSSRASPCPRLRR